MSKPSLLLIPGMICTRALWEFQANAFADMADVTIADTTCDTDLSSAAVRLLATAPDRFALAGLSMGGYLAFEIMRQQPNRIERLALLDTSARPDLPFQRMLREALVALAELGRYDFVVEKLLPMLIGVQRLNDPNFVARVRHMVHMAGGDGAATFVRQQTAILARPDSRPLLRSIDCPTLVLCGRDDIFTPPDHHEEMAALIPQSDLVMIEHAGHLSTMEQPEATTAALRRWFRSF